MRTTQPWTRRAPLATIEDVVRLRVGPSVASFKGRPDDFDLVAVALDAYVFEAGEYRQSVSPTEFWDLVESHRIKVAQAA